jgi:serine/threonine protein kinase
MPVAEARLLVANLASALAYLHEENLVLGNLRPEGVWKTENGWVLADFSQLRLIGDQAETSPEGQQGAASPAGDVWSLGVLLRRVLTDDTGRKPVRAGLPAPFQRIVRECLEPNPEARASLERVEALLNQADAEETPVWTPRHRREADETSDPRAQRPAIGDFFRTPRLAWVLIAMVGILGVVVWTLALLGKSETPPPPAQIAAAGPEADRIAPPGAAAPTPQAVPSDPAVGELLDKWIATMRAKDLNGQMALYAPLVDTYYKQHRVPKSRVASDRKHEFNAMGPVKKFEATRIHITQLDPSNAVIEFDKNWVAGGNSARSAHSQLTLKKIGGEWKILGERELKTRNS